MTPWFVQTGNATRSPWTTLRCTAFNTPVPLPRCRCAAVTRWFFRNRWPAMAEHSAAVDYRCCSPAPMPPTDPTSLVPTTRTTLPGSPCYRTFHVTGPYPPTTPRPTPPHLLPAGYYHAGLTYRLCRAFTHPHLPPTPMAISMYMGPPSTRGGYTHVPLGSRQCLYYGLSRVDDFRTPNVLGRRSSKKIEHCAEWIYGST